MTTQFAKASYQEIIDLHTEEDTVSVIGIHTPQGDTPRKMFGGFFDQFKKFKYLGCSVSLVPAARLPADPSQVSYEAGEQYIDPRDMLNPLMFHGCHGNDMGVILNRFYNANSIADSPQTDSTFYYADSVTDITDGDHISGLQLEDLYYKALTDNTWKKAHPQRGFKKAGLRPLVYSMATNMQFSGGNSIGMSGYGIPEDTVDDVSASGQSITATFPVSQDGRRFFTPRLTGLGWLDTRNVLTTATTVTGSTLDIRAMLGSAALNQQDASEADLPLVYMGMILLPPAYKTEQYFRMIVNHHFAFKDFRGISFSNNLVEPPAYNQLNDPNDRYYPEGGSVDPPTPDPPEPDPPEPGPEESISGSGNSSYIVYKSDGSGGVISWTLTTPNENVTIAHDGHTYVLSMASSSGIATLQQYIPYVDDNKLRIKRVSTQKDAENITYRIYYVNSNSGTFGYSNSNAEFTLLEGFWNDTSGSVMVSIDGATATTVGFNTQLSTGVSIVDLAGVDFDE